MTKTDTQWSAARPLFWGFLTVALLLGGLGGWSVLTTLAGAVIAPGQVEVSQSRQIVQHPDGGIVHDILVKEGDAVKMGDILLRLDGSALRSELAIVENQIIEIQARVVRLKAQSDEQAVLSFPDELVALAENKLDVAEMLDGQASLFARQTDALMQARDQRLTRIRQIESQIEGLAAQKASIAAQVTLLEEELVTQRDLLEKGLTQTPRVSALERELAQMKGRLGELVSAQAEAEGRITETRIEITALTTQHREKAEAELRDLAARELELRERQRALKDRIARLEVRAPASGLVLGLEVTTRQSVVRPADALMFIVPQDRPLLVVARVPVTHIDEIRPGQDVRLVFSSLPSRITPELRGKVSLVSADAFTDERSGMNYFRAEIALDSADLSTLGDVAIVPGMPVETFIKTADRTPLAYLLKPFTDYFRTAFRET
jgi:HlyD family secretion protein